MVFCPAAPSLRDHSEAKMEKADPTRAKMVGVSEDRGKSPHVLQAGSIEEFLPRRPGDLMYEQARDGFFSLEQWETQWQEFLRTVENPHSGCGIPPLPEKSSPWEDTKAFLASFEQVAKACQWPQGEWATRLLPALSGEVEKTFNSLDVRDREDYGKVKAAILRGDTLSQEKQRYQFRHFCYREAEGPRGAYNRLREMCRGWLRVESKSKEEILELLILEQLLSVLPPEIQSQVRESGPESCSQAVALAEEFLLRQEKQAEAESNSVAGHALSETTCGQALMAIKQEEDREACLLGGDQEDEELSFGKAKQEVKGNFRNQGEPKGKKGTHVVEKMDDSVPYKGEGFHEVIHMAEETYKCLECGINLSNKTEYNFHLQTHSGKKTHPCLECGKSFLHPNELASHCRTHTGEKPYNCCGKGFSHKANLMCHQRRHPEEKPYECSEFGATFRWSLHLQQHQRLHTGDEAFECSECGKRFLQKSHLEHHQRSHEGEKSFECSECGKRYRWDNELQQHQRTHKGEKLFECLLCGKKFNQIGDLQRHQRIHRMEKPFECLECGKRFPKRSHLQQHLRIHTGEKPYGCSECGKRYTMNSNLLRHVRSHANEKPFECSACGKKFGTNYQLQKHLRTHTGEKLFECSACGRKFRRSSHLKQHQRIHIMKKPFECSECGKKFPKRCHLQQHLRIHTGEKPYGCSECGKRYTMNSNLLRHLRTHANEKPFECSTCGKKFGTNYQLQQHLRTHTGEKVFECSACGKKFGRGSHLKQHQRIHEKSAAAQPATGALLTSHTLNITSESTQG